MKSELSTAFQPIQIIAYSQPVHLKPLIGRFLRSRRQDLRRTGAIVANEVGRKRNFGAAFYVSIKLLQTVSRFREELPHAQQRIERTRRFVHLKVRSKIKFQQYYYTSCLTSEMYTYAHMLAERDRETEETRLKSWLRRPATSPQRRILGGAMTGCLCSTERANYNLE